MRPTSGQLGALSPPREESVDEDRDVHPALRVSTPLKSSLKSSSSKIRPDPSASNDASGDEEARSTDNGATPPPPPRSPDRVASGISPIKKKFEPVQTQPNQQYSSSTYSSDARRPEYDQSRSKRTPTPTGTYKSEYDYPRASFGQAPTIRSELGYSRQRASPTRSETSYNAEYDQPRSRASPTRSENYSPEYSQNETPRAGHGQTQQRPTPSPSDRLATTYKPGYDLPRPRSSPASGELSKPRTEYGVDYAGNECSHRCTSVSSSTNDQRSSYPRALTQVNGPPDRNPQQLPSDLDSMLTYEPGPGSGMKVLRAPSTMRSQPKMSHVDSDITPAKLRSSVWRTSSRGSADSVVLATYEPVKNSDSKSKPERAAPDQMDGAADFVISVPSSRGSFMDLRGEFERRGVRDSQASSLPVSKSRTQPRAVLTKKNGPSNKPSWTSSHKSSPRSTFNGRIGVRPRASRVMGLAAMFDTAAKASPFIPTPGGAVKKKRSETARVISPYTSNPSPRASVQSMTSVSTPVSLMSPTRLSIHLSPARSIGKKSMIPRLQNPSATYSTGKTERHISVKPMPRYEESRVISATASRILTPSRLPIKKKVPHIESPSLPQFDGVSTGKQSVLKLNAHLEIRPGGYHSSPMPQTKPIGSGRAIPQLSQHSTSSRYSDERGHSRESTAISPTLSRVRSASSLRDQIRSLRTELSSTNEECTHLRSELEDTRKTKEVNEILLREDLDRAKAESQKWRRRAEKAEKKVEKYERLAMQIKDARDNGSERHGYRREQQGDTADSYSFMSGSDKLTGSDRAASQPLTARMNQSVRRTPPVGANGANSMGTSDGFSECSSSTVVRTQVSPDENGPLSSGGLWTAVDELVDFASPGILEEPV